MDETGELLATGLCPMTPRAHARPSLDLRRALTRVDRFTPRWFAVAAALSYLAISVVTYWPMWPGDPNRLVGYSCACGDPVQQSWFLGWVPWALLHGHNPLFTNWIDYPSGVNLGINTEMPLLGLLAAPITLTAGSVASFNFLIWLAFPLSAMAAFFVLRRWTRSNAASAFGGLLYGFSPYLVGEGFRHLDLVFVPLPPLIFMALHEILVEQRSHSRRWGVALGLLVTAQYLISPEVLSTTFVIAFCALVVLLATRRRAVDRRRLIHARDALLPGVLIPAVLLAYPAYFFFAGPRRFHGPVQRINNPFRVDLLGPIVPTSVQRFAPSALVTLGDKFAHGFVENGSYLGIALLLLAVWLVVRRRSDRRIVFAGVLAAIAYLLSLGPKLMIANHRTPIPMPFDALVHLPLLDNILPSRFSLYEQFFVAVVIALGIAQGSVGAISRARTGQAEERAARRGLLVPPVGVKTLGQLIVVSVFLFALVSLVPNWPTPTVPLSTSLPPFFTSPQAGEIPAGSVVLTYPFDITPENQAMLWQETSDFRWKLVGGYALIPQASGAVSSRPPALRPRPVQRFLAWEAMGRRGYHAKKPPADNGHLVAELRLYIRRYGIETVVFDPVGKTSSVVLALFERALGEPVAAGGVDLWLDAVKLAREPVRLPAS